MRNDIVPLIDMDETFQQNISPVFALCFHDIIPAALRLLSGSPYCTLVDSVGRGSYYLPRPLFYWARRRNGGIKSNSLKADNNNSITVVWKCFPQSCLSIKFSENLLYFECFHMNEHVTMLAGIVLISAYKQWTVSYTNLFDFTEFNEFHLLK